MLTSKDAQLELEVSLNQQGMQLQQMLSLWLRTSGPSSQFRSMRHMMMDIFLDNHCSISTIFIILVDLYRIQGGCFPKLPSTQVF